MTDWTAIFDDVGFVALDDQVEATAWDDLPVGGADDGFAWPSTEDTLLVVDLADDPVMNARARRGAADATTPHAADAADVAGDDPDDDPGDDPGDALDDVLDEAPQVAVADPVMIHIGIGDLDGTGGDFDDALSDDLDDPDDLDDDWGTGLP